MGEVVLDAQGRPITWDRMSAAVGLWMVDHHGEWCGMPMPVEGKTLTIEDRNPWKATLADLERDLFPADTAPDEMSDFRIVNEWYSKTLRCCVVVVDGEGKRAAICVHHDMPRRAELLLDSFAVAGVWNMDAELRAQEKLAALIKPHLFDAYRFTGAFLETSPRSKLTYIFRRGRPTVAIHASDDGSRVLCTLCMHPIGYYEGTFCGSMVPTDEVIAHLLLMRGDEHLYWRRCNQHSPHRPESGL